MLQASDIADARCDLRDRLLHAHASGALLAEIDASLGQDPQAREDLASALLELHNEGLIDVVAAFSELRKTAPQGHRFFLVRRVFEKILPRLSAPVPAVMTCVLRLYKEAGHDFVAGAIVVSFVDFCSQEAERPGAALEFIESNPEAYVDLLPAVIASGSCFDSARFLGEAIRLCGHTDSEVRQRALFSLSCVALPDGQSLPDELVGTLEHAAQAETDDFVLASVVAAAGRLCKRAAGLETQLAKIADTVLARGGKATLAEAAQALFINAPAIADPFLAVLLNHLRSVRVEGGVVDNLDFAIATLIQGQYSDRGVELVECLLRANPELKLSSFDSAAAAIIEKLPLAAKILTRWLGSGEEPLCEAIAEMVQASSAGSWQPEIDPTAFGQGEGVHALFLGRKAVGYLFPQPLAAASIVVSLMRVAPDEWIGALRDLLFDPLLLNYTGSVRDFVAARTQSESERVAVALREALAQLDEYLEDLGQRIPALAPSLAQQEAHGRHFTQEMKSSIEAAEASSAFLSLFPKCVLLYGRKSIDYVWGPNDECQRMETALARHGVEFEMPRLLYLDPSGLDYQLRVFRAEQLTT